MKSPLKFIDVFSPLLYDISTTKAFEKQFVIEIQCDIIEKFKLENDYKEIFDKLNKKNWRFFDYRKFIRNEKI